jgi:hypothetical protein
MTEKIRVALHTVIAPEAVVRLLWYFFNEKQDFPAVKK